MFDDARSYVAFEDRVEMTYRILAQSDAPLTVGQVAKRMGMSPNSGTHVRKFLHELIVDGDAVVIRRDTYRPLPTLYYAAIDQSDGAPDYWQQVRRWSAMVGISEPTIEQGVVSEQLSLPW